MQSVEVINEQDEILQQLPLEQLIKLQKQKETKEKQRELYLKGKDQQEKRRHKDAPKERDFRAPLEKEKKIFKAVQRKTVDPRFDEAYGTLNVAKFADSYKFIKDMQQQELQQLDKVLNSKKQKRKLNEDQVQHIKNLKSQKKQEAGSLNSMLRQIEKKREIKQELKQKGVHNPYITKKDWQSYKRNSNQNLSEKQQKELEKKEAIREIKRDREFDSKFSKITKK